jgi:CBS domain-containing protein
MKREDTASEALDLILEKKVGSVVVVDKDQHPLGIVTTRDFLKFCLLNSQGKKIELITRNLSQISRQKVGGFFNHLSNRIGRLSKVDKARLMIQEEKNGALFKVALSVIPKRGKPEVIHKEGRDLTALLKKIKKQ